MELKDIVCDFEYAEKMKDLGVNRDSIFFFVDAPDVLRDDIRCSGIGENFQNGNQSYRYHKKTKEIVNTYTVAELGKMLPARCDDDFVNHSKDLSDGCGFWIETRLNQFYDKKEANARAKLLIWIIENKHVNIEELNK